MSVATRVQPAALAAGWGDQSKEEGACAANAMFMMLIKASALCGGDKKLPHKNLGRGSGAVSGLSAYLLLMTKAAIRITASTTLPETETSRTVELAPSPMIREGTGKDSYTRITLGKVLRAGTSDCHKFQLSEAI